MQRDPKRLTDGFTNVLGGVDSGTNPSVLKPNQFSWACNVTLRGGFMRSRPGYNQRALMFDTEDAGTWFYAHKLQGAKVYDGGPGKETLVCSVGGRIFQIDLLRSNMVTELTPVLSTMTAAAFTVPAISASVVVPVADADAILVGLPIRVNGFYYRVTAKSGNNLTCANVNDTTVGTVPSGTPVTYLDPNPSSVDRVYFEQAEQYLVIQDGQSRPIIFDGGLVWRRLASENATGVPVGTAMAYGLGRLWIATGKREFIAGDIVGGPTGVLKFTENSYLAEGGKFSVQANAGRITGMAFVATLDTSLGQGPLLIFTERAIYTVSASANRETWKTVTNPIQTVSMVNYGAASAESIVLVNGDAFCRAKDGIRSFIMARRDFHGWGNVPVSRELNRIHVAESEKLIPYASGILLRNRLLMTVLPGRTPNGITHDAVAVLDFDLISTMREKSPPVWEGIWTGVRATMLVKGEIDGEERGFVFGLNSSNQNALWEITADDDFDGDAGRVEWFIESRSMDFGNVFEAKRIEGCEMFIDSLRGNAELTLEYRPDQYPCWADWKARSIASNYRDCDTEPDVCKTITEYRPGYRTRLSFGQPPDESEPADRKPKRMGYDFQVRLSGKGPVRVKKFIVHCQSVQEEPFRAVENADGEQTISCCAPSEVSYDASLSTAAF